MDRRTILTGAAASGAALALMSRGSRAQQAGKVHRIGVLLNQGLTVNGQTNLQYAALRKGMEHLGYVEGTNLVYEVRPAEGQPDRLPGFAADLVSKGVDLIVSFGGPPTNAARNATTSVPIVFALVADPVAIGVAESLERPGKNLTGVTNDDKDLAPRQMALLKEMLPKLSRVAIYADKVLKGAKPAETAIEVVSKRELAINLKAASALGLTVPPELLKRADRVIE